MRQDQLYGLIIHVALKLFVFYCLLSWDLGLLTTPKSAQLDSWPQRHHKVGGC